MADMSVRDMPPSEVLITMTNGNSGAITAFGFNIMLNKDSNFSAYSTCVSYLSVDEIF